jgi:hypothetical protein
MLAYDITSDWPERQIVFKRPKRIGGPVCVSLCFGEKSVSHAIARIPKIIAVLVKHNVIDGDHRTVLRGISASWSNAVQGVRVTIEPAAAAKAAA